MPTYVLRAEAKCDVDQLLEQFAATKRPIEKYSIAAEGFDVMFELTTAATLDEILAMIMTVPDGHVMYRTVQEGTLATGDFTDDQRVE
ncbi:hypothetical protein [Gordonia malaquae]|uniref:hypothetical protein n=1 Tax=Gordonia malaquae TaxID=410332 RepID=UPI003016FCAC